MSTRTWRVATWKTHNTAANIADAKDKSTIASSWSTFISKMASYNFFLHEYLYWRIKFVAILKDLTRQKQWMCLWSALRCELVPGWSSAHFRPIIPRRAEHRSMGAVIWDLFTMFLYFLLHLIPFRNRRFFFKKWLVYNFLIWLVASVYTNYFCLLC